MKLVQLIYASCRDAKLDAEGLQQVLDKAIVKNRANDLSGFIAFSDAYFLQLLEGAEDVVNGLYNRIANDPRHREVCLLSYQPIRKRDFPSWDMGYVTNIGELGEVVFRYGPSRSFNPYQLSPEGAHGFLMELRAVAATQLGDQGSAVGEQAA